MNTLLGSLASPFGFLTYDATHLVSIAGDGSSFGTEPEVALQAHGGSHQHRKRGCMDARTAAGSEWNDTCERQNAPDCCALWQTRKELRCPSPSKYCNCRYRPLFGPRRHSPRCDALVKELGLIVSQEQQMHKWILVSTLTRTCPSGTSISTICWRPSRISSVLSGRHLTTTFSRTERNKISEQNRQASFTW